MTSIRVVFLIVAICMVAPATAKASDLTRCDPNNEDFWGTFGCDDARRARIALLESRLWQAQSDYRSAVSNNADLARRVAAAENLKRALALELSESELRLEALRRELESAESLSSKVSQVLAELEALDRMMTIIIDERGHCLTYELRNDLNSAQKDLREVLPYMRNVAIDITRDQVTQNLDEIAARLGRLSKTAGKLLARVVPHVRVALTVWMAKDLTDDVTKALSVFDPICWKY